MRFLLLFTAAVCACGQTLPPLVDIATYPDWLQVPGQNSQQFGIASAVDAQGNVVFAGAIPRGMTFPGTRIGPTGDTGLGFPADIAVFKMDPQLSRVIFSVVVGGSLEDGASSMTVRADGGVVLAGFTNSQDFPMTTGVVPDGPPAQNGFVMTLTSDGKLESSRIFPSSVVTFPLVSVGSDGDIYVTGLSRGSTEFPATTGAYTPTVTGNYFVARLKATTLESTFVAYLSNDLSPMGMVARPGGGAAVVTSSNFIGLNSSGSQLDFDVATNLGVPSVFAVGDGYTVGGTTYVGPGFEIQQFSLDGRLLNKLHPNVRMGTRLANVGPDGTLYMWTSGATYNALEACKNNQPPPDGVAGASAGPIFAVADPAGNLRYASFSSINFGTVAFAGNHYMYAAGIRTENNVARYGLYRLDLTKIPTGKHVAPSCITNAASYIPGQAAPGQVMSIFGSGLGPDAGVSFQLENGKAPMSLAGTSVTVDGKPAPLLYAQDQQINFIVPWSVQTQGTFPVCVARSGETACISSFAGSANPGIFEANGQAIVVRQDWTRVTKSNQPKPGEVVTMWVTGLGSTERLPQDGEVSGGANRTAVPVKVAVTPPCFSGHGCPTINNPPVPWTVEYAGAAPGMLAGIMQLNLRFPGDYPTSFGVGGLSIQIQVGDAPAVLLPFDITNPLP